MKRKFWTIKALWVLIIFILIKNTAAGDTIELWLQSRIPIGKLNLENQTPPFGKGTWYCSQKKLSVDTKKLAIIVVDMWNSHPCSTMLQKEEALIPLMNTTLNAVRKLGIQVIFAPSRCNIAEKWKGKPQRSRVEAIKNYPLPPSNGFTPEKWPDWQANCMCPVSELEAETQKPVFNCKRTPQSSDQHGDLIVMEQDMFINAGVPQDRLKALGGKASVDTWGEAGQQELYNICMDRGITYLLYVGCATNMCIVNREFGMVQARRMGLNPILIRDLTHAMTYNGYNPDTKMLDPDFTPTYGTELCIREIERYIGPSITSEQLLIAAGMAESVEKVNHIGQTFSRDFVVSYKPKGASNCYRQLCLDYNWSGGDVEDYFTKTDPVEIAEFCEDINLDALVLLNVPHQGFTTYQSEIGPMFPGLKSDFFNGVLRECHDRNIAVIGYITLGRNWIYAENHLEQSWQRSEYEKFIDLKTPYIDLLMAYIKEVLNTCPIDALRFDTLEDNPNSRNKWANEFYNELYHKDIPNRWDDSNWRQKWDFYRWSISRVAHLCYETAKGIKPKIEIWQNGFMQSKAFDMNNLEAGRYQDMAYIEIGDPFRQLFLTGILRLNGCIVGKILESPVRRLCMALGARGYSYYRVNQKTCLPYNREWFYNDLAPYYKMVEEIQPYLEKASPVPYFGVLYAEATRYRWDQYDRSHYVYDIMQPLTMSYLDQSLITEYICNLDLPKNDYSRLKLIVIPETSGLQLEELNAIKKYVKKGGQLLITGEALCYDEKGERQKNFSLSEEMGISYDSLFCLQDSTKKAYSVNKIGREWENEQLPNNVELNRLVKVKPVHGKTVLSINMDGNNIPLLTTNETGKGTIAYLATSDDINLTRNVINAMSGSFPMTVYPDSEQVIMTYQEIEKQWILHILSDEELVIDIDHHYANPKRIIKIYPENGWKAETQKKAYGLRIHAAKGAQNRLIVLK
jgi:nicotinamidase-related amidase